MFPLLLIFSNWTILVLRIVLGALFVVHGWPKIKDLKTTHKNFEAMGFKPGRFWGTIAAALEFFGGIALIAGILTQLIAIFFAIEFLVILVWRIKNKHSFIGGYELDLIIFAAVMLLVTVNSGFFSLNWLIGF
jgi:putative oxidoreductase